MKSSDDRIEFMTFLYYQKYKFPPVLEKEKGGTFFWII